MSVSERFKPLAQSDSGMDSRNQNFAQVGFRRQIDTYLLSMDGFLFAMTDGAFVSVIFMAYK